MYFLKTVISSFLFLSTNQLVAGNETRALSNTINMTTTETPEENFLISTDEQEIPLWDLTIKWSRTSLGIVATILGNMMRFPQLYKVIKTKQVEGISQKGQIIGSVALFAWLVYGMMGLDYVLVLSTTVSSVTQNMLIFLTWKYRQQATAPVSLQDEI